MMSARNWLPEPWCLQGRRFCLEDIELVVLKGSQVLLWRLEDLKSEIKFLDSVIIACVEQGKLLLAFLFVCLLLHSELLCCYARKSRSWSWHARFFLKSCFLWWGTLIFFKCDWNWCWSLCLFCLWCLCMYYFCLLVL